MFSTFLFLQFLPSFSFELTLVKFLHHHLMEGSCQGHQWHSCSKSNSQISFLVYWISLQCLLHLISPLWKHLLPLPSTYFPCLSLVASFPFSPVDILISYRPPLQSWKVTVALPASFNSSSIALAFHLTSLYL